MIELTGVASGVSGSLTIAGATKASAAPASGVDFAATLRDIASSTAQALGTAEQMSVAGLQGKASAREVVDAVMHAEQTLQTAIALRDKTVAAIQEITRMAI
jgi:flagellar hook-basal body complex protein FliE